MTKTMSFHDVLNQVQEHDTSCTVTNANGSHTIICFKYPMPISHHNQAMQWFDETNNQWHDPIAFSAV